MASTLQCGTRRRKISAGRTDLHSREVCIYAYTLISQKNVSGNQSHAEPLGINDKPITDGLATIYSRLSPRDRFESRDPCLFPQLLLKIIVKIQLRGLFYEIACRNWANETKKKKRKKKKKKGREKNAWKKPRFPLFLLVPRSSPAGFYSISRGRIYGGEKPVVEKSYGRSVRCTTSRPRRINDHFRFPNWLPRPRTYATLPRFVQFPRYWVSSMNYRTLAGSEPANHPFVIFIRAFWKLT